MGILILEDDSRIADLLRDEISRELGPNDIFEASNPIDGLAIFEKNKYKITLIICDYFLPIQNGKDFVEIVKDYSPQLKICIFTGDLGLTQQQIPAASKVFYKNEGITQVINFVKKHK